MAAPRFRTVRYRKDADRTFGRMESTTLRVTGAEAVFERVNARNKGVLKALVGDRAAYEGILKECGKNPRKLWMKIKEFGKGKKDRAVEVTEMSLGNPNLYGQFPPNPTIMGCMREAMVEELDRVSCSYDESYGVPRLRAYLRGANMSDPESVNKDPSKFGDVKVFLTPGGSQAAPYAMGPLLLTPNDTVAVHDWIYIIHLGAAYYRNAHVANFELREDGVPDPASLRRILYETSQNGKTVQCVVSTTIGNPIGSATPEEIVIETMRVIEEQSRKEGRPIVAFFDPAYEAFRRNGKPLDAIEIAKDNGIEIPVGVFETASKGLGLCGIRLGALRMWWPGTHFSDAREDYFKALDNHVQPTLGLVPIPIQVGLLKYFMKLEMDADAMARDIEFFRQRREAANKNLVEIAKKLGEIEGVYLARYYTHSGEVDPNTLASFYLTYGFHGLTKYGARFNQMAWQAEFGLDHGHSVIKAVPGFSFLPEKRLANHPALIRVTGLTDPEDTDAFLKTVAAAAEYLKGRKSVQVSQ